MRSLWLKCALRALFVAGALWALVFAGLTAAVMVYGENDNAQQADVIIVLGAGLRRNGRPGAALTRRSEWAAQLYTQGLAPAIICTGGVGHNQRRSEASACRELLLANGVPDDAIYIEERSRSTQENAIFARAIMDRHAWSTAVIVTDSFHMLRADWIFNLEGIAHYRSSVPHSQVSTGWLVRFALREVLALHWYAFKETLGLPFTRVD